MKRFKYSIVLGIVSSIIFLLYMHFNGNFDNDVLLVFSVLIFIFMTFSSYFKIFSNVKNEEIKFKNVKNAIYSGQASHYKDGITVGGNLYLLKDQLVFQTNILNFIQKHESTIDIKDINEIHFEKTMGFVNNGISIIINNGLNERFVVTNRENWQNEIERIR